MLRQKRELAKVGQFQKEFDSQQLTIDATIKQRVSLLSEEITEFGDSKTAEDRLDALIDIKYVAYGTLIRFNQVYHEPRFISNTIEELQILLKGYAWDSDVAGICDVVCEIIKWADEYMSDMIGELHMDEAFDIVHDNNMAKYHVSDEHWQLTMARLGDTGHKVDKVGEHKYLLIRLSDNKIIKPFDHIKVSLSKFVCLQ